MRLERSPLPRHRHPGRPGQRGRVHPVLRRSRYPSLNDPSDELALAFRGTVPPAAIPTTLVIDRSGRIAARILGSVSYDSLRALITQGDRRGPGIGDRGKRGDGIVTSTPVTQDTAAGRAPPGRAAPGAGRLAALGLAAADLDADRADPAVPAGRRQRARIGAAAGGHRPGGGHPVLHRPPGAGPDPEPAVAVQRVRRALVRGHLPAAVPVPGGLRAAPDLPAGRVGPAAAAAGAAAPGPAADVGQLPDRAAARAEALASAARLLGGQRFRLRAGDGWVSAEKGYLREVGNLLFHIALLALLASIGLGGIFGYKANRLLVAGQSFADTPTALDVFRPGRLVVPVQTWPRSASA